MVHEKEDKYLLGNFRPISLLSIFHEIFEREIYNFLFHHFKINSYLTPSHAGSIPGDEYIFQQLSIIRSNYSQI